LSNILNQNEDNSKEKQRLISVEYEQLQQLIHNAERLHYEKQALLESRIHGQTTFHRRLSQPNFYYYRY
jgi:hypothetical protein